MLPQKDAIVRLLRDDDPSTVRLVKQQLAQGGVDAIADLRDLLLVDDEKVTRHVSEVIGEIDSQAATDALTALCPVFPEDGDLEAANWLLARAVLPGVDVNRCIAQLDAWADALGNVRKIHPAEKRILALSAYIGTTLNFRGNADDYYSVDNSMLPRVVATRLGIPISLTLIYMLIGKRCGVQIEGVNFPGHFLARHDEVLFDPFERGRILRISDCEEILARQRLKLQPTYLDTASSRAMLRRILANLLYAFQNGGDADKAARVTGWIHALER